jgi:hypothetical protein
MAYTQVGDTCYPSELAANNAIASSQIGRIVQVGTASYVVDSTSQTATQITYQLRHVASTAVINKTSVVTPVACQALTAGDALEMSWLIVAAWVGVFALMFITRALRGSPESTYGTS